MRFPFAVAVFAVVAMPGALVAQTASGTVGASARVQASVTFQTPVSPLAFGTITPGTPVTLTPAAGNGTGIIGVSYNTEATVTVGTLTLTGPGGATIATTLSCAQAASSGSASPTAFGCSTGYLTSLTGGAATTWFIYVGGQIAGAATTTRPAGNYSGTVTLTANFSTF